MDLLDGIEDYSASQFKPTQANAMATTQQDNENSDSDNTSQTQPNQSILGFDFNITTISKALNSTNDNQDKGDDDGMPNLSILDKVKNRLLGGGDASDEDENTNPDDEVLDKTQKIVHPSTGSAFQLLPQLEIDETEFSNNLSTQVIPKMKPTQKIETFYDTDKTQVIPKLNDVESWFTSKDQTQEDADNVISSKPLSKEEREAKIAKLAEQKRRERLEKERQELEQDLTKGTITDEEEELNQEANDTVVSSHYKSDGLSTKELEKAQEFLNIQKRHVDIRPEFQKKVVFTKDKLLSEFSEEEDCGTDERTTTKDKPPSSPTVEEILKSSPFTSPVKDDHNDDNVLDLFKKPSENTKNPLELYAQRLKKQLFSSPQGQTDTAKNNTKHSKKLINLDSDSDIDLASSSPTKKPPIATSTSIIGSGSKFSNRAKELDNIPELSKEQRLLIKQKFSKRKFQNSKIKTNQLKNHNVSHKQDNGFMQKLREKHINQLKLNKLNNPDHLIMEELEKDEETMTSLLEREMERVRNIRKREKLQERAKLALLEGKLGIKSNNDSEKYGDEIPESDVADSEVPDSDYNMDNDDDEDDEDDLENESPKRAEINPRSDDSYMFGGGDNADGNGEDEGVTTTLSTQPQPVFDNTSFVDKTEGLFQNLQPRTSKEDSFISTQGEESQLQIRLPLFRDLTQVPTQTQVDQFTQVDEQATQADDVATQKILAATQKIMVPTQKIKNDTQIINKPMLQRPANSSTKRDDDDVDDDDDDDIITPANVRRGRKMIRNNNMIKIEEDDEETPSKNNNDHNPKEEEEEENDSDDPEEIQRRIKEYELKIRKRELKLRKRRKEMERKGMKNIVEGEAEESEDEWKGLGGIDEEFSDVVNSDDEKMIDNNFNIDLKNDEIRSKFMEEYQIKDQKELEKLLDDIKNHRLIKRTGINSNGLDIEISDEEDQLLEAYRKQKFMEQQQRLLQNKKLFELYKNEKSKAFFNSIQDTVEVIKIDDSDDSDIEVQTNPFNKGEKKNSGSETDKDNQGEEDEEEEDSLDKEAPIKKTIKVDEAFIRKKLSFLYSTTDEDKYERLQRISRIQHGISDGEEDIDDINVLKTKSFNNLTNNRLTPPVLESSSQPSKKRGHENDTDVDEEVDEEFMPVFKKPSIVKSFKSFQEQQGISIKDGKHHFSGVTISKQYKVVAGSKASITYMSKNNNHNKNQIKNIKEEKIQKSLHLSRRENSSFFDDSGFE